MRLFFRRSAAPIAAVAVAICSPAAAWTRTRAFDVPAQAASSGIRLFARQAGIEITLAGRNGEGRGVNQVRGRLDVRAALDQLLSGTGLMVRSFDGRVAILAAEAAEHDDDLGDIVVTGTRAALRRAIDEKRASENFVEVLRANDVGKLPDQNVAEAVKRLPGVSVANDQGEGRYAIIRGIDPNLVNITLNGQTLPAPEPDGRQVKLDDLPSALIQSVTVTKSLLPSQDANAIGGEVDIRTRTAFDSKEPFFLDARGALGWYGINGKSPFELDGTLGGRFGADERFGAVVSVNYSRRPIESENFQGSEDWSNGIPAGGGPRDYNLIRARLGIVGNFDWHPGDDAKLYIRSSYSRFQDHETRDQNLLADFDPKTGTAMSSILVRHREENDNTRSVTLGGDFHVGDGQLSMSGGWTRATKADPIRGEFTFGGPEVAARFDPSTHPYSLLPAGADAGVFDDPALFTFSKIKAETRRTFEQLWQVRIDYDHPIGIGAGSSFQIGVKYTDRHKNDDHDLIGYKKGKTGWTLAAIARAGDPDFYGGMFHFGQRADWAEGMDYIAANAGAAVFDRAGNLPGSLEPDYDVKERIIAGYAMATLRFGRLTLVPGARVERTRDRAAAKKVDIGALGAVTDAIDTMAAYDVALANNNAFNVFGRVGYTDIFPGLNAKYEVARDLLLRGAVTTSIGRPNYSMLAPFVSIQEQDPDPALVTAGNPELKPYRAVNFDASIEYYPTRDAVFSAGFFHKIIRNPIYAVERHGIANPGTIASVPADEYAEINLSQPRNLDSEHIAGVELNAQTQFSGLPGFWGGFGVSTNYTHVWGNAKGTALFREGDRIPLAYQSRDLGNISIFYEKHGVAARLAFNYRSPFMDVVGASSAEDSFWDAQGQLDLHISYQVSRTLTVFGDAINVTDSAWRHYIGAKDKLAERERYGPQLRAGAQMHF